MRMLNGLAEKFLYNDQGVLFFNLFFPRLGSAFLSSVQDSLFELKNRLLKYLFSHAYIVGDC